ncbi:three-finger protein 5 [Amia ocellicauda]|uniref:three-finger protein 5 n=1 Tax=Amia ocellicauda TaxID=2972642 RepID=UPI0034646315
MKGWICTFLLLLSLTLGETLKCNRCIATGSGSCSNTVQTCGYNEDACIRAIWTISPYGHFRRCIKKSDCLMLQGLNGLTAYCCYSDRCN